LAATERVDLHVLVEEFVGVELGAEGRQGVEPDLVAVGRLRKHPGITPLHTHSPTDMSAVCLSD
jgi:hypothetical protein